MISSSLETMMAQSPGVPQARQNKKNAKGPRPKHVPQRMCISCRERSAKRTLIRIVRSPEGEVAVDLTGKKNGRGAYLCDDPACWRRALSNDSLSRALKIELPPEAVERLSQHAATLPPSPPQQQDTAEQQGGVE
jgi:predicted RNA-binding protein YlxR (DUF448 family)